MDASFHILGFNSHNPIANGQGQTLEELVFIILSQFTWLGDVWNCSPKGSVLNLWSRRM